eukprot:RCo030618
MALPFSEPEYRQLLQLFEKYDEKAAGKLSWTEVSDLGAAIGKKIDQLQFKKIDRDRSGYADWSEVLRCIYPSITVLDVRKAVKSWGFPHQKAASSSKGATAETDWRRKFTPEALEELTAIYELYCRAAGDTAPGTPPASASGPEPEASSSSSATSGQLTREALRQAIPRSSIPDAIIDEVFTSYDFDKNNVLSLEEFACIMEDTYLTQGGGTPEVRLFFQ